MVDLPKARTGGLGGEFFSIWVEPDVSHVAGKAYKGDPAARTGAWFETEWRITSRIPRPKFTSLIDRIEHVARVAGADHAGIGSDFDGISSLPEGIDSAADLPKIAAALRERGFQADIAKIFSGNILRVMRTAEKVAARASGR